MQKSRKNLKAVREKLHEHWGYSSFRPGQEEAVRAVLEGRDTLVLFPTGGGKSLCYQAPALVFDGLTLVISPLVSLMQDQVGQLNRAGIRATYINSTVRGFEVEQRLINARNNMYRLLYIAPERLETTLWQNLAPELPVSLVAVDEAHCISQWGHDFRPSYRRIRERLHPVHPGAGWIALTATATPEVRKDILHNLDFKNPAVVASGFQRPNLRWWVNETAQKKKQLIRSVSRGVEKGSGIVYAGTRAGCEKIADLLNRKKIAARPYHAGISGELRQEIQKEWLEGTFPVVVATNAFGMGIDKADCRFVIHYDMPFTLEAYYQESGRSGRDGREAYPILLYKKSDYDTGKSRLLRSYPDLKTLEVLYDVVCDELNLAAGSEQEEAQPVSAGALATRSSLDE
ncbi:MAG: RecQ family ATP-dependent DNA helicase, partial [Balneolaceae bacterium]